MYCVTYYLYNYVIDRHYCKALLKKAWTQVLRRLKSCSRHVGETLWQRPWLEIKLNAFAICWSVKQKSNIEKQFIIIIIIIFIIIIIIMVICVFFNLLLNFLTKITGCVIQIFSYNTCWSFELTHLKTKVIQLIPSQYSAWFNVLQHSAEKLK